MPRRQLPFGLKRYGPGTFEKIHACGSGCITASGIPDLLDEGRYGKFSLFAHIIGLRDMSPDDNELLERGHRLQAVAAEMFADKTGRKTRNIHARVKHPDLSFYASPDMLTASEKGDHEEPGEIKVVAPEVYEAEWKNGPPRKTLLQHQAQLLLTGATQGPIVALINGDYSFRVEHWQIKAHKGVQRRIERNVANALRQISNRELPPPDLTHPRDQDAVIALASSHLEDVIPLPEDALQWVEMYKRLVKVHGKIERKRKEIKARLIDALQGHRGGVIGDHIVSLLDIEIDPKYHAGYTARKISIKSLAALEKKAKKKRK